MENKKVLKYEYRRGDLIRSKSGAEYEILQVEQMWWSAETEYSPAFFQIKNLSPGCLDAPKWVPRAIIYTSYEPVNSTLKLLYGK